ncbi:Membrane protein involved in the export of O-antigen and teichoic acid [Clostridium cavendishii DSM 21758]|uniref:Membrane protein involved in the export of O-antigen and teichoic acid n=1 Tax=Clostridium cavendishii DSM 21758 TaxID=1121302 RepID=A0A1M6Q8P3_9CLOT|nr:polysaccharide biosynthesis C-terminal domain-containing protein [Clostridium cavendishii]SHK16477.1 Membrane protein involved in the export of O-antigen and teichoic acid [Clostridium cavendishii DSM 21758]
MKKSFIKVGIIYSVGQILSKAITFLLMPLYIKKLGIEVYGQLALVDTILDFILSFVIVSIFAGFTRYYREYNEIDRKKLKNTAINFALIMIIIDIIFVIIFGRKISSVVIGIDNSYYIFCMIVMRAILTQFIMLMLREYDLNYEAQITVVINLVNMLASVGLTILFVVKLNRGIKGIYEAYNIVNLIILIYLFVKNLKTYKMEIDFNMLKSMLKFSAGLIPSSISSTVLTLSDRYFLKGYKSYAETGIYSMGYKFGTLIDPVFVGPFNSIFTPFKFQVWSEDDASIKLNNMYRTYHLLGCFFLLGISMFTKSVLLICKLGEQIEAYKIVPLILISYFVYGKAAFYSLGIQVKNKTYLDGVIMMAGGILNILLNIVLIKPMGMYGAATATIVSYLFMNILYYFVGKKFYFIKYENLIVIKLYIISIILYVGYYFISKNNQNIIIDIIIATILMGIYLLMLIILKIVSKEEVNLYILKFKNKLIKR